MTGLSEKMCSIELRIILRVSNMALCLLCKRVVDQDGPQFFLEDKMSQTQSFQTTFGQVELLLNARKPYGALCKLASISLQFSKDIRFLSLMASTQEQLKDFNNLVKTQQQLVVRRGTVEDKLNLLMAHYKVSERNQALDIGLQLQAEELSAAQDQKLSKILVKIYLEENDFDGAQEVITKCLFSEADDFLMWAQGIVHLNADHKDKALDYFRKAVQLNASNDQAWVSLGIMHKDMGDDDLSAANIEKAIDLNPFNTSALKLMTTATTKNTDKAQAAFGHLRFYLSEFCFDEEISLCHVQMLCQLKQWDAAELEIDKLLFHQPESSAVKNMKKSMIEAQVM